MHLTLSNWELYIAQKRQNEPSYVFCDMNIIPVYFLAEFLTDFYLTNNIFLLRLKVLGVSDKRIFSCNSVPHQTLQASPDSQNLFYYHDEMNGESPPVITTGQKDSIVPASVSDIRIYGNSENYFW